MLHTMATAIAALHPLTGGGTYLAGFSGTTPPATPAGGLRYPPCGP